MWEQFKKTAKTIIVAVVVVPLVILTGISMFHSYQRQRDRDVARLERVVLTGDMDPINFAVKNVTMVRNGKTYYCEPDKTAIWCGTEADVPRTASATQGR